MAVDEINEDPMGTNYFLAGFPTQDDPDWCGEWLHIGKSSAGWRFIFRAYPNRSDVASCDRLPLDTKIATTDDWRTLVRGMVTNGSCTIVDEYGDSITPEQFFAKVDAKRADPTSISAYVHDGCPCPSCGAAHTYADDEGNDFTDSEFC